MGELVLGGVLTEGLIFDGLVTGERSADELVFGGVVLEGNISKAPIAIVPITMVNTAIARMATIIIETIDLLCCPGVLSM